MAHNQHTRPIVTLDRFPPTVVDHENYMNGVDLFLLDGGTEEEPRFLRIYDDQESEAYL